LQSKSGTTSAAAVDRTRLLHKVRLHFERDDIAAFYPHQAVLNAFHRAVRLAELPVRFTEGFDPHPRISIPYALSVGIGGEGEVFEIELHSWLKPSKVAEVMNLHLPRGLRVVRAKLVPPRRASFVILSATYEVVVPSEHLAHARVEIKRLKESESWMVLRPKEKGEPKPVDIRKYLEEITLEGNLLRFRLEVTNAGTARPREIAGAVLPAEVDVRLLRIRKRGMETRDAE
jgi:radical SAM-linked protein